MTITTIKKEIELLNNRLRNRLMALNQDGRMSRKVINGVMSDVDKIGTLNKRLGVLLVEQTADCVETADACGLS